MQWAYSDYPAMKDGGAVLTSGSVEIEMTSAPRLTIIKMGPTAEPNTIPRSLDTPATKWRITSDVPDDLKRFINGKYWCQIGRKLFVNFLRARGMTEAADAISAVDRSS
jgi:hypothetical protein